jgi:PAS domain S-box-containing protein
MTTDSRPRARVRRLLRADRASFREAVTAVPEAWSGGADRRSTLRAAGPADLDGPGDLAADALSPHERDLVWRLRLLDEAPVGCTLTGPAYQDTPVLYATRSFRRLTGYDLSTVQGENPRFLQGPATEADAVADLREAVDIWEPVTVELTNYRADGTAFCNRVSLVPLPDETGTVGNWVGMQAAVGPDGSDGSDGSK